MDNKNERDAIARYVLIAYKNYLTKDEAAIWLDRGVDYINGLVKDRMIPTYNLGGKVLYIKREDLEEFISGHRFESAQEIASQAATNALMNRTR